jgi:hypothetical protein
VQRRDSRELKFARSSLHRHVQVWLEAGFLQINIEDKPDPRGRGLRGLASGGKSLDDIFSRRMS